MSTLKADTIQNTTGGAVTLTGQTAAKAWLQFDGTGTVSIRESGGVASITDNGTGDYTVNFTSAMPDANYAVAQGSQPIISNYGYDRYDTLSTTFFNFQHRENLNLVDSPYLSAIVVR